MSQASIEEAPGRRTILYSTLVVLLFTMLVVAWSLMIPVNGAPDESTHLFLVEYLYTYGKIPSPGIDPAVPFISPLSGATISKERFWYYGLPYLHTLGATATAHLFADYFPLYNGYLAVRAFNWLLAPVFAISLLTTAGMVGVRGALYYLAPIAFLLVPQLTFLFAYFNADAFALTATTLALALMLWAIRHPHSLRPLLFGLGCGLVMSSKIYFYPSLVFFSFYIVYQYIVDRKFPVIRFFLLAIAACAAVALPVLGTTYLEFGEFTGLKGQVAFTAMHLSAKTMSCFIFCSDKLIDVPNTSWWLFMAGRSFFYGLGWMNVWLSDDFYSFFFFPIVAAILAVSLLYSAYSLIRYRIDGLEAFRIPLMTLLFWSMTISVILLNIIGSQMLLPQPQGRYLYVAFPFAAFLVFSMLGRVHGQRVTSLRTACGSVAK